MAVGMRAADKIVVGLLGSVRRVSKANSGPGVNKTALLPPGALPKSLL